MARVASNPISEAIKDLYAGLFAYFRAGDYRGDPEPVRAALDGFGYSTVADVVTTELFPPWLSAVDGSASRR